MAACRRSCGRPDLPVGLVGTGIGRWAGMPDRFAGHAGLAPRPLLSAAIVEQPEFFGVVLNPFQGFDYILGAELNPFQGFDYILGAVLAPWCRSGRACGNGLG